MAVPSLSLSALVNTRANTDGQHFSGCVGRHEPTSPDTGGRHGNPTAVKQIEWKREYSFIVTCLCLNLQLRNIIFYWIFYVGCRLLWHVGYQKRQPTLTANKVGLQCQPVHSGPLQQQSNGKTAYIITGNSNIAQNYIIYETLDAPEWLKSMEVLQ